MPAKRLEALALSVLPCVAIGGELETFFDAYPYISVEFGSFTANVLRATTTGSYGTCSNGSDIADRGPCSFGNTATDLSIASGGWHGTVDRPGGRAAGTLDCRMDFTFQLLGGAKVQGFRRKRCAASIQLQPTSASILRLKWHVTAGT
jgi:hypothetical protein